MCCIKSQARWSWVLSLLFLSLSPPAKADTESEKLLETLLVNHAHAREAIKSARVRLEWTIRFPEKTVAGLYGTDSRYKGERIDTGKGEWLYSGGRLAVKKQVDAEIPATGWSLPQQVHLVFNEHYLAFLPNGDTTTVYQYDHESVTTPGQTIKTHLETQAPPDVFRWGFSADTPLLALYRSEKDTVKWDVVRDTAGNDTVYHIVRHLPTNDPRRQRYVRYTMVPGKGFLLSSMEVVDTQNGGTVSRCTSKLQELENDIWFPLECEEIAPSRHTRIRVIDVEINTPIDESLFLIDALPYDRDRAVLKRMDLSGVTTVFRHSKDAWLPSSTP